MKRQEWEKEKHQGVIENEERKEQIRAGVGGIHGGRIERMK